MPPELDPPAAVELTDDEKRIVHAQQQLNEVRRGYKAATEDGDEVSESRLQALQMRLCMVCKQLRLAECGDIDPITDAITEIQRHRHRRDDWDDEARMLSEFQLESKLDKAVWLDPARAL